MTAEYAAAFNDIVTGFASWRVWGRQGWQEVKRRYRRTIFGPFWATLSLGIFIGAMAFIWAPLFHADVTVYLPFITTGLVSWTFVTSLITEGCGTYTGAEGLIKQLNFPFAILPCTVVWRNVIVLFHNLVIVVVVLSVLPAKVNWNMLLFVPGVLIIAFNGIWMGTLVGMVSTRFRDVPQIVGNVVQVLMFVTPIFWFSQQLGAEGKVIIDWNYMFHIVNIIRAPLLGDVPSLLNYEVAVGGTFVGCIGTFMIYARFFRRIAYWL